LTLRLNRVFNQLRRDTVTKKVVGVFVRFG
jgi:hypothetical protein